MEWYIKVLKQYADFKGRARRKEFWMFTLFNFLATAAATILDNVLGLTFADDIPYGPIYVIYVLGVLVPGIAVGIRRLHDVNKSGWWIFIALVPLLGTLYLLYLNVKEGDAGKNQYGPDPKASERKAA